MVKRRTVFLARHGETAWNAEGRLQGGTDIPLNARGRVQAKELAALVRDAGVSAVMSSDLARARETAEIVAETLGLSEERCAAVIDAGLRERRFGIFEGLTPAECEVQYRVEWRAWKEQLTPPAGGEATEAVFARFDRAIENAGRIGDEVGPVLVVSHGGADAHLASNDTEARVRAHRKRRGLRSVARRSGRRDTVASRKLTRLRCALATALRVAPSATRDDVLHDAARNECAEQRTRAPLH